MNNLLNKFVPKEPKFFPLLKDMAEVILIASDLIINCVQISDYDSAIESYKKIKDQEKKSDILSTKIFNQLNYTFITPFDREDIHLLTDKLDQVTDYINSCAKRIMLFNPQKIPKEAIELTYLIKDGALLINKAVAELVFIKKNQKKIKHYCIKLHEIEHKADEIYENYLIYLFANEKDAIEIVKLKEIMFELEKATDAAEYVAKTIKTFIIKYA